MQLINKTYLILSCIALSAFLEAKSIDILLDHKTTKTININADIPQLIQEDPNGSFTLSPYFEQLIVENCGSAPVKHCFPSINGEKTLTLRSLAHRLSKEADPLSALYQLWVSSVICDDSAIDVDCHPLDLLNFRGICTPEVYRNQFIALCNALGIETRQANVLGKSYYDFGVDGEWALLDLQGRHVYYALNNEKLVSSETIMDDPFLLLRTKHERVAQGLNFEDSWKQLALFDILQPAPAEAVVNSAKQLDRRSKGVDLFPEERLIFKSSAICPELLSHLCHVEHCINLRGRKIAHAWDYSSPFPIHQIVNESNTSLKLVDYDIELQPGEHFVFDREVFNVVGVFTFPPTGHLRVEGAVTCSLFPALVKGKNTISLGTKKNASSINLHYQLNERFQRNSPSIAVENQNNAFDYCTPSFNLKAQQDNVEKMWWQIGSDPSFKSVPASLDQVEDYHPVVSLSTITETFLNPDCTYYFRVKGLQDGKWSEWSRPYPFVVKKPIAVEEVCFEELPNDHFELNWERHAEESSEPIEYLVFGSNAIDFVPSVYCDRQVNAFIDGQITETECNDNLVAITNKPKIEVSGGLAYYRIIARQKGQLSVPSTIIRVYDQELIQPRNVLQAMQDGSHFEAKRVLFPSSYSWKVVALPLISASAQKESPLLQLKSALTATKALESDSYGYQYPNVPDDVWDDVRSNLLPENHPAWPKLNRLFCKVRATQSPEHFRQAGFRRWRPGRWSRVAASANAEFPEYFIKAYCDTELGVIYDWKKWLHRIRGAETIRTCIKENHLDENFKVPHKWIYPLPANPSPPNSARYARKNFILVCENMRIQEHSTNEKMYKHNMTRKLMDGLYIILQVCGLNDSVYVFNMPFCKDGKIAIIDTEYHHKWPVPFNKLNSYFSKDLRPYWQKITYNGGKIPPGIAEPNPPRMDRRDVR